MLSPPRSRSGRRRRRSLWGLGAIAALSLAAAPASPSQSGSPPLGDRVRIVPEAPRQGDTLVVVIAAPASAAITVQFDGRRVPAFSLGGQLWRALIGTDPETPIGVHRVAVTGGRGAAVLRSALSVRLRPGHFGVRRLTLPPRTFGLITPRNLELERRALDPVLRRLTPLALWRGPFLVPSAGPIDSPYGDQGIYNGHREWWHQGVDIDAPEGTPVAAANTGVVALARPLPLGGLTVLLDHGQGVVTEYLHLMAVTVREGQRVNRGAVIGRIGASGLVTGPSLHWALFVRGVPVNPLFWTAVRPGLTGGM